MTDNKIKMPVWGPYSKKYMGISKIINELADKGARYDFSVHPTLWNSSTPVPNVTVPSNYHLWNCKNDYTFIHTDTSLCGKTKFMLIFHFQRLTMMHTL